MDTERKIPTGQLSRVPSWLTLGFLGGALAMYSVYPRWFGTAPAAQSEVLRARATAPGPALPTPTPTPVVPTLAGRSSLEEAEAVFLLYRNDALWDNDRTEFALWNRQTDRFSEFFEVYRDELGRLYFRAIPTLTRPVIQYQDEGGRPIRFTESEENRERRLSNVPLLFREPPPKL